jgi:GMP synthase (glutamine-hydrolysing)
MEGGNRYKMILIIKTPNRKLHDLEFIKPIEDILIDNGFEYKSVHFSKLNKEILSEADKIIISGTSLKDNSFLDNIKKFNWIKDYDKPILGICGGMHILGLVYNGKIKKCQEIGLTEIIFKDDFLGFQGKHLVYELHNLNINSSDFNKIGMSEKCIQATKHKNKPFYGVQFHPEVRNKSLIVNFLNL